MLIALLCLSLPAFAATSIPFTINLSKVVNVTGTPRIAIDVGGVTRYASYTSGSGTSALTFTYTMVAGDIDLDGVTVSSPIDLNGGTIIDNSGNNATLTFTPQNTANVKVNYPSLGIDFVYDADGRFTLNGTVYNDLTSFLSASGGTFSRASVGTYFDSAGILQTAASGVPRFDYDPITHAAKGVLIENSVFNLFARATEFDNGTWVKSNITATANLINAPDATLTADLINEGSAAGLHTLYQVRNVTAGKPYTISVYAKAGTGNLIQLTLQTSTFSGLGYANFDLTAGTVASTGGTLVASGIQSSNNGWYRCFITETATASSLGSYGYIGMISTATDGRFPSYTGISNSIYLWGAQFELNSFPSSYIPTTTAAVARAADALTIPTESWFNSST
jgi:hypothetical protein